MIQHEAIILAAGRGDRLHGVAAPFHKPLMLINGRPLIVRAVEAAVSAANICHVIVVAAPENVVPMSSLLTEYLTDRRVTMVVQPEPRGPGAALLTGLAASSWPTVMVLLGDNVLTTEDIEQHTFSFSIGFTYESAEDAKRFTRLIDADHHTTIVEDHNLEFDDDPQRVWVGPLVMDAAVITNVLSEREYRPELKIGDNLCHVVAFAGLPILIKSTAYDVGVPEMLT